MKKYRLEVYAAGAWILAASGLTHAQVLEESLAFSRFKIIEMDKNEATV